MKLIEIDDVVQKKMATFSPDKIEKIKKETKEKSIRELNNGKRIQLRETRFLELEGVTATATERILGENDLFDINYFERGIIAGRTTCRIILKDDDFREVGYATGFKVSPRLLITNHHVFRSQREAKNAILEFNYETDSLGNPKSTTRFQLMPERFFLNNPDLDYALVAINDSPIFGSQSLEEFGFLRLNPNVGKINKGEYATIIQHPGGQTKQIAIRDNQIISDIADEDISLMYYSDTAQGSSGAPVFNDSWQVVALHYTGIPRTDANGNWLLKNGNIASRFDDDADVDWIANSGIRASKIVNDVFTIYDNPNNVLFKEFESVCKGDLKSFNKLSLRQSEDSLNKEQASGQVFKNTITTNLLEQNSDLNKSSFISNTIKVPLELSININDITIGVPDTETSSPSIGILNPGLEIAREPWHDLNYNNRMGYDDKFLGLNVPMPSIYSTVNLSQLGDEYYIPYHKFTIVNNKKRRLALFTASNIDGSNQAKKPEHGKSYSRKALAGLAKNDREKWFIDPRIPLEDQLSDEFYNKDRTAFDKGHLVRRDDVAWGDDYDDVRKSNGDTYHITNCSPQVLGFNRSNRGGIWGKLENNVLKQAKNEKLCVFSGPVLLDNDPEFSGKNNGDEVIIKIPRAYWKIIVALNQEDKLQAFGFLLAQDLSKVQFEFDIDKEWEPYLISISDLEKLTTNIRFMDLIKSADQYNTIIGEEILSESKLIRYED